VPRRRASPAGSPPPPRPFGARLLQRTLDRSSLSRAGITSTLRSFAEQQVAGLDRRPRLDRATEVDHSCRAAWSCVVKPAAEHRKPKPRSRSACTHVAIIHAESPPSNASDPSFVQLKKNFRFCRSLHAPQTTLDQTRVVPVMNSRVRTVLWAFSNLVVAIGPVALSHPATYSSNPDGTEASCPFFRWNITRNPIGYLYCSVNVSCLLRSVIPSTSHC